MAGPSSRFSETIKSLRVVSCEVSGRGLQTSTTEEASAFIADFIPVGRSVRIPVFLVASKEYQRHKGLVRGGDPPFLSQEQSQIPALLAHLETTARDRDAEAHLRSLNAQLSLILDEMNQYFRRRRDHFRSFRPELTDRRQAVLKISQPALATLNTRLGEAKSEALLELAADKKA